MGQNLIWLASLEEEQMWSKNHQEHTCTGRTMQGHSRKTAICKLRDASGKNPSDTLILKFWLFALYKQHCIQTGWWMGWKYYLIARKEVKIANSWRTTRTGVTPKMLQAPLCVQRKQVLRPDSCQWWGDDFQSLLKHKWTGTIICVMRWTSSYIIGGHCKEQEDQYNLPLHGQKILRTDKSRDLPLNYDAELSILIKLVLWLFLCKYI